MAYFSTINPFIVDVATMQKPVISIKWFLFDEYICLKRVKSLTMLTNDECQ